MVEKNFEKLLSADVDAGLADSFLNQADTRGYKKKRALASAIKLWTNLPEEIQARLLNQSLDADGLVTIVEQIVDERIEAGRQAARKLLQPQRKKRPRKD